MAEGKLRAGKKSRSRSSGGHSPSYECRFCQRQFGKVYNLMIHERSHKENSPTVMYHCQVCDKGFTKQQALQDHK